MGPKLEKTQTGWTRGHSEESQESRREGPRQKATESRTVTTEKCLLPPPQGSPPASPPRGSLLPPSPPHTRGSWRARPPHNLFRPLPKEPPLVTLPPHPGLTCFDGSAALTPTPVLLAPGPAANHHTPGRPGDKGLPGPGAPPLKPALIARSSAQRPQGDPTAPRTADRTPCHCHGGTRAPPSRVPQQDPSSRWAACPYQGHLLPGRPLSATEALADPPSRFSLGLRPDMLFSAFLPPLLCSLGLASPYGPSAPLKGHRCWAVLGPSPAAATSLGDSLAPWPPPHGPLASSHAAARPGSHPTSPALGARYATRTLGPWRRGSRGDQCVVLSLTSQLLPTPPDSAMHLRPGTVLAGASPSPESLP
ncbi:basic proline-rich protein-like isoform X2 [Canis lupus dingo]|uniref:basic proline-rich protein-like isoform X2 n=1 Tax=Canis lupus dingo TaxID=286419 RepID=UPI0015F1C036|nr:basic proline-rich protein-like isoform X2 [Canis lupus dingo]